MKSIFDVRRLLPKEQEVLRRKVVELRKKGVKNIEVANRVGLAPQTASRIWRQWLERGEEAIVSKKRGRKKGKGVRIAKRLEAEILHHMAAAPPGKLDLLPCGDESGRSCDNMKRLLACPLWSREAVRALAGRVLGECPPPTTTNDYLGYWGITPGRSVRRDFERSREGAAIRIKFGLPPLKRLERMINAETWWLDTPGSLSLRKRFSKKELMRIIPNCFSDEPVFIRVTSPEGRVFFSLCACKSLYHCFYETVTGIAECAHSRKNVIIAIHPSLGEMAGRFRSEADEAERYRIRFTTIMSAYEVQSDGITI